MKAIAYERYLGRGFTTQKGVALRPTSMFGIRFFTKEKHTIHRNNSMHVIITWIMSKTATQFAIRSERSWSSLWLDKMCDLGSGAQLTANGFALPAVDWSSESRIGAAGVEDPINRLPTSSSESCLLTKSITSWILSMLFSFFKDEIAWNSN